ncbi:MAG: shikimate dehydrogenase [Caldilineaceae bacterium]|nr:shikimate dehydrogenase [Caldilineaceae bacterium]MBP8106453.1 shikimate dehydrogenase [Caldilineaceae bacterium]MBP8122686.1 shikimate dehydrogenase [Caldilineaceae bacterium]MBP9072018.1 shikimate dehydrogenase [Caldilineaceae bacterium]
MPDAPNYQHTLVALFGHPVAENPTGVMQEAGFDALGLMWRYLNFDMAPDKLADAIQAMRTLGIQGANCTVPFKVEVLQYLDEISPDARLIGAVNTIRRDGDRLIGENTDGKGFMRSLADDADFDPAGRTVVIFGAGGAARAITVELALAGAAHIIVVNRSRQRGMDLVEHLNANTPARAEFVTWGGPYAIPAGVDMVINATSIALYPDVDDAPDVDYATILPSHLVCDVIPNPPQTPFLQKAAARGAKTLDGLGMLVYQGAIAFEMWTGQPAPVDVMKAALAQEFGVK